MNIKVGDTVKVIAGKDKGKEGEILRTMRDADKVVVKNTNIVTKHVKKRMNQAGEIVKKEAPLHVSNVMVKCPSCNATTRVAHKISDSGKKVRVCKKCASPLDKAITKKSQ
jgi:large subunit ribosomal protein L24